MMNLGKCFITDELGSTAIEYALVAAGIALTALTTLTVVGTLVSGLFGGAVANLSAAGHG